MSTYGYVRQSGTDQPTTTNQVTPATWDRDLAQVLLSMTPVGIDRGHMISAYDDLVSEYGVELFFPVTLKLCARHAKWSPAP